MLGCAIEFSKGEIVCSNIHMLIGMIQSAEDKLIMRERERETVRAMALYTQGRRGSDARLNTSVDGSFAMTGGKGENRGWMLVLRSQT